MSCAIKALATPASLGLGDDDVLDVRAQFSVINRSSEPNQFVAGPGTHRRADADHVVHSFFGTLRPPAFSGKQSEDGIGIDRPRP